MEGANETCFFQEKQITSAFPYSGLDLSNFSEFWRDQNKAMPLYSSMPCMSKDMSNNSIDQREVRNCFIVGVQRKEASCHIFKQLVTGRRV